MLQNTSKISCKAPYLNSHFLANPCEQWPTILTFSHLNSRQISKVRDTRKIQNSKSKNINPTKQTPATQSTAKPKSKQNCNCRLENNFVNLGRWVNGAAGYVNMGQCVGSCTGRTFSECEESGHTILKRILKRSYGRNAPFEMHCVPTSFETIQIPMLQRDGGYKFEEFKTLKASECGCRWEKVVENPWKKRENHLKTIEPIETPLKNQWQLLKTVENSSKSIYFAEKPLENLVKTSYKPPDMLINLKIILEFSVAISRDLILNNCAYDLAHCITR